MEPKNSSVQAGEHRYNREQQGERGRGKPELGLVTRYRGDAAAFAANARNAIAAAIQKDMLVDSVACRDGRSNTPVLEAEMSAPFDDRRPSGLRSVARDLDPPNMASPFETRNAQIRTQGWWSSRGSSPGPE